MFQGSKRRFGITTNVSGLNQGIVINNLSLDQNLQSAQARDQKGKLIDIAVYGDEKTVAIDGLYTGDNVGPGTIIKIENTNFVVTSTGKNEINTGFQTANINARYFSGEDPGPGPGPGPEPIIPNPSLSFKAVQNGGANIQLNQYGSPNAVNLLYRKNNQSWSTYNVGDVINLDKNDVIFLSGANDYFNIDSEDFYYFTIAGKVEASGNIMSLMNFSDSCSNYCFYNLFKGCDDLLTAPQLPATTLARGAYEGWCYAGMFYGCTSLTAAPQLPATTLARGCYAHMFQDCYSLTAAPQLPATTLASDCYRCMFDHCTSLTAAPNLPATTLAEKCYIYMFKYCTSLVIPPIISATTLADWCCAQMFRNCTSLTVAPQLPATTIAPGCYEMMFQDCSSLTDAPQLPASTLFDRSYRFMFIGCSSLSSISVNFTDWNVSYATAAWVKNVADQGVFTKPYNLSLEYGDSRIPEGWQINYTGEPVIDYTPLTLKAVNGPANIQLNGRGLPNIVDYSVNNGAWSTYNIGDAINLNENDTVAFSGAQDYFSSGFVTPNNIWMYYQFAMEGKVEAYGNIMSLMNFGLECKKHCFLDLFYNCSGLLTTPSLPATGLAVGCYANMFQNCKSLTAAPQLLSLNLADSCYSNMFNGCSSLITPPQLPATTLAPDCYYSMFGRCYSLTAAPYLLAKEAISGCYSNMFVNCWNLLTAPKLPATTLGNYCYSSMFASCSSLLRAPDLPATELCGGCYNYMFSGCKSLVTAPQLPATTLANYCYQNMFDSCSSLLTAPQLPATTLGNYCYQWMFNACQSLTAAPDLPATGLADHCYAHMFQGCTSLTSAPYLSARAIYKGCYQEMFNGCNNICSISADFADWSVSEAATNYWVQGVAANGTFYKSTLLSTAYGSSRIPVGWQIVEVELPQPQPIPIPSPEPEYGEIPITFRSERNYSGIEFIFRDNGYNPGLEAKIRYSINDGDWKDYTNDTYIILNKGETVAFSGANSIVSYGTEPYHRFVTLDYSKFTLYGNLDYFGNKYNSTYTGLLSGTNVVDARHLILSTVNSSQEFNDMFAKCKILTAAPELPASTVYAYSYMGMFDGCSSLVIAPSVLPAASLYLRSYAWMFRNCINLKTPPRILATTLRQECCDEMFRNCYSLTAAPQLPASTIIGGSYVFGGYDRCYRYMFENCYSLTAGPYLPSRHLAKNCYAYMFRGCSGITTLSVGFIDWQYLTDDLTTLNDDATAGWVIGVAANGTFYKPSALSTRWGDTRIPVGWNVVNTDQPQPQPTPQPISTTGPITFRGLKTLNSISLASTQYLDTIVPIEMNCKINDGEWEPYNIGTTKYLEKYDTIAFSGANDHFSKGVNTKYFFRAEGQFEAGGNVMSLMNYTNTCTPYCFAGLFYQVNNKLIDVTNLTLPATNLAEGCYHGMFENCKSLTAAPQLPATTLVNGCYDWMFRDCSSLSSISVNFTSWGTGYNTQSWVNGVQTSGGTFYKPAALSTVYGTWKIPSGWTVINK